mgnify:CR=1 FL=1
MSRKKKTKIEVPVIIDPTVQEFLDMFGDKIPDPDLYPRQFSYYLKLFHHVKSKSENVDHI